MACERRRRGAGEAVGVAMQEGGVAERRSGDALLAREVALDARAIQLCELGREGAHQLV